MSGLQVKFRPQTLDEIIGNKGSVEVVRTMFERPPEDQSQAWIITGERGTGKTTLARIIAQLAGSDKKSVFEINGSKKTQRGIDAVEEYEARTKFPPLNGGKTALIIDECQGLSKDAKSALLKVTEEVPPYVIWIFVTTEPQKFPKELFSRCTPIPMHPVNLKDMTRCLKNLLNFVGFEPDASDYFKEVIEAIYHASGGILRDGVKLLDTVMDLPDANKMLAYIRQYIPTHETKELSELVRILLDKNMRPEERWKEVQMYLKSDNINVEGTRYYILTTFKNVLMRYNSHRAASMMRYFIDNFYNSGEAGLTLALYHACHVK